MIIKETYIGISLPYQMSKFKFGKVDCFELIGIEEGENVDDIREKRYAHLLKQLQTQVNKIVGESNDDFSPLSEPDKEPEPSKEPSKESSKEPAARRRPTTPQRASNDAVPPRRRRPRKPIIDEDDIPF